MTAQSLENDFRRVLTVSEPQNTSEKDRYDTLV